MSRNLAVVPSRGELEAFAEPVALIVASVAPITEWLATATDVDDIDEVRAKAVALTKYAEIRGMATEAVGAAQTIERRAEMALGRVLPRQPVGRGKLSVTTDKFTPQDRARFRSIYEHDDVVERVIAELAPVGEATRSAVLSALKRATAQQGRADDQAARQTALDAFTVDAQGDGWHLMAGDFRDRLAELPAGCADVIVTDPPYPTESLPLYSGLSFMADHLLADDGVCLVLTGQISLGEVFDRLREHLTYGWTYCQPMPGANSRILSRHVLQSWKPWVAMTKGTWPAGRIEWHPDMLAEGIRVKDKYRWQQDGDPVKMLMGALCPEGGTVVDPFTGTGAYGVAALAMGRRFIGCELDGRRFNMASSALAAVTP